MINIEQLYQNAKDQYAEMGIDTDTAIDKLKKVPISLHCWQADDVGGFEHEGATLDGGGIQATGNYPGKPRNIAEMRMDLEKAYSLIPGNHRLSIRDVIKLIPIIFSPGWTGQKKTTWEWISILPSFPILRQRTDSLLHIKTKLYGNTGLRTESNAGK